MENDKLPAGVVLGMEQVIVGESDPCLRCYFVVPGRRCPKEYTDLSISVWSCTNSRDVIFREIGVDDETK